MLKLHRGTDLVGAGGDRQRELFGIGVQGCGNIVRAVFFQLLKFFDATRGWLDTIGNFAGTAYQKLGNSVTRTGAHSNICIIIINIDRLKALELRHTEKVNRTIASDAANTYSTCISFHQRDAIVRQ